MSRSAAQRSLETKLLDLNELLEHEVEFFQANPFFKHQVQKTIELDADLPRLELVATNITQVIENLVSNALTVQSEVGVGSTFTIELRRQRPAASSPELTGAQQPE